MKTFLGSVITVLIASTVFASDVWVVQGSAQAATPTPCLFTLWVGDVLFFNTNPGSVNVALIGTSDSPPASSQASFTIGAGQAATLNAKTNFTWVPSSRPPIWVDHLSVPDGVRIESRLELSEAECFPPPASFPAAFGKLSFPVYRSLAPAGSQQLFLGADNGTADSRVNIGVYNAGTVRAAAHLEVRRACDDLVVATEGVTIAPNSLTQFSLQPTQDRPACIDNRANAYANYATVTVDQPSLAYVSTLSNHPLDMNPPVLRIPAAMSFSQ